MAEKPRIFLSAVTKELGSLRDQLAVELRRRGCDVAVQEEFRTTSGTLLEKLHDYILECHAVICLMGDRYGAEPPSTAATRYAFSFTRDKTETGATPRHSYTQWEYLFARRMNKATFVFLPLAKAPRDPQHAENPETEELRQLQQDFIQKDVRLDERDRTYFESLEQIKDHLAAIDFQKLLYAEYHDVPLREENPYVGLRHFEETERDYFFGRDRLVADLLAASEESPLLLVYGASGSGKSSAVRAGLIPSWRERSKKKGCVVEFTPDEDAFEGFYLGLSRAGYSQQEAKPAKTPSSAVIRERFKALRKADEPWLVFIDQFEEIFTRTPRREDAQKDLRAFIASLVDVAADPPEGLRLVLAMRDDFFSNLEGHSALCAITDKHFHRVSQMDEGELRAVIQQPAASHGVAFEPGLVRLILDDLADPRGRLPLPYLEYTLEALWEKDDVTDRVLNIDSYKTIGGVRGALQQRVTGYYRGLAEAEKQSLRRILLRLVEIGETQVPVSRAARKQDLATDADAAVLEQLLSTQKLLVAQEGAGEDRADSVVELAHEALITGWDEFEKWVNESREAIALRNRLREDAQEYIRLKKAKSAADTRKVSLFRKIVLWFTKLKKAKPETDRRRAKDELWTGSRLERALELREAGDFERIGGLSKTESAFLDESEAEKKREVVRLRRRLAILSALTVAAVVAGIVAVNLYFQAEAGKREAQHNEGLAWMLRAEVAVERGNLYPDTLLYAAQAIGFDGVGRPEGAAEPLRLIREDYRDGEDYRAARDWIASHRAYRPLWSSELQKEEPATAMAVHPTGRWLALGSADGVRMFDLTDGGRETALPELAGVTDLAFAPDGEILAIAAAGGVRQWMMEERRFAESLEGLADSLAWSPGGDWLAGAGDDGSIQLWRDGAGAVEVIPRDGGGTGAMASLAFSPENSFLAGVAPGVGPRVWFPEYGAAASAWTELRESRAEQLDERDRPAFLERVGVAQTATCVAVSPDGQVLAAGTREIEISAGDEEIVRGGVVLWEAAGAEILGRVSPEQRHDGGEENGTAAVRSIAYRPDGNQLASGAEDGTIKVWAVSGRSLRLVATLTGHRGAVTRLVYSASGEILASAGADGSAKLWDVSGGGAGSLDLDLYAFQESGWYTFTPDLEWKAGAGFLNDTAVALATNWRRSEDEDAVAKLVDDAKEAEKDKRWRRVALLASQLEELGATLPETLARGMAAALPPEAPTPQESFVNGEGMALIWCPETGPEGFRMGSPEGEVGREADETPHQVILTHGFWLGKYEVTQAAWLAVMGDEPSTQKDPERKAPVETITWHQAVEFCRRLTDRERARGTIRRDWEYRLPTEAQWEYACRAGTEETEETAYSFGNDPAKLHEHGNYADYGSPFVEKDRNSDHNDGYPYTAPVGEYPENPWGFHDMHGNVWEWCLDAFAAYGSDTRTDPYTSRGSFRVIRGGSFGSAPADCRSAGRGASRPAGRSYALGLRPALVPSSQPVP
ncbi:MAG: SUMF1/EgtB/PvdO family nonheme iron enzyme [Verrucomicrobiales bacterium]